MSPPIIFYPILSYLEWSVPERAYKGPLKHRVVHCSTPFQLISCHLILFRPIVSYPNPFQVSLFHLMWFHPIPIHLISTHLMSSDFYIILSYPIIFYFNSSYLIFSDLTSARSLCRPFVTTPSNAEASVADPTLPAARSEVKWDENIRVREGGWTWGKGRGKERRI